jgi:hypothetical protein
MSEKGVNRDPCGPGYMPTNVRSSPKPELKAVGRQVVSDPMSIHAARQLLAGCMKQRGIGEHAIEMVIR